MKASLNMDNYKDDKCGDPELPFGSEILSDERNDGEDEKTIICKDGLKMIDANNDDIGTTNVIACSHGTWNSSHIQCECKNKIARINTRTFLCPRTGNVCHLLK